MRRQFSTIWSLFLLTTLVAACADNEVILPGERIAITDIDAGMLTPDPEAAAENAGLAALTTNSDFVAPGQSSGHRGGHFSVDLPLDRLFSTRVGVKADLGTELAQPVANQRAVYTVTSGGIVIATDAQDGSTLWQVDIDPSEDQTQTSISGGIALAGDDVIVHASKTVLYSLKADTGQENWQVEFSEFLADGPSVAGGVIIISDLDGKITALTAEDGEILWSRVGGQDSTRITGASIPAISGVEVIASGGDGEVIALNLNQGEFLWGENLTPVQLRTALDSIPDLRTHPIHDGGLVFIATPSADVLAFNANTGREVWQQSLRVLDMPWLSGETLYMTTIDGRLYALRRRDGAVRWMVELPGAYDPALSVVEDAVRYTTPMVISGQVLVASSRGQMLTFDAMTGAAGDVVSVGDAVTTAPIVANNTVYVLSRNGQLTAWQ